MGILTKFFISLKSTMMFPSRQLKLLENADRIPRRHHMPHMGSIPCDRLLRSKVKSRSGLPTKLGECHRRQVNRVSLQEGGVFSKFFKYICKRGLQTLAGDADRYDHEGSVPGQQMQWFVALLHELNNTEFFPHILRGSCR